MDPMIQTPTLSHLLRHAIENRLLDMHTALIAEVESYDSAKQQVNVKPILKRRIENTHGKWMNEELPMLCDIPVLFSRAGGFFLTLPLRQGDFVQLIINEEAIDEWFSSSTSMIANGKRFSLQGAVAIPGIHPQAKALSGAHETNLVLGRENGPQIHVDDEKIRLGSHKADEALAIASKVREELDRIKRAFNNHSHVSSSGPIKPTDKISASSDIATKKAVAE